MRPLRILIADDHEGVRRGIRSLLSSGSNWVVCGEAADGSEAVEEAKSLQPDVVLMDISMPRMNGLDATRIIQREVPSSVIVIVSQNDPGIGRRQASEAEAAAYIAKSDLSRELLPMLDRLVARRNAEPPSNAGDAAKELPTLQEGNAIPTSARNGTVAVESILCTEELRRRPSRAPDHEKENRALVALGQALADSPRTILQTLADTILEVCEAGSAGISLLRTEGKEKRFYWPAIAGSWKAHIGGGTPRDFGPCGDVLDRNMPLLFSHVERRYTYFQPVTPVVEEALLIPFYVEGKAVGTIWAVAHDERRKFDAEDERIMISLGTFASSAYQILVSLDALKFQVAEREKAEASLRLAHQVACVGTFEWNMKTGVNRWSRELETMYGLPVGGFAGTQSAWEQLVHHEDRDAAVAAVQRAMKEGAFEGEWRVVWPDGSIHWLMGRAFVFRDQGGEPERLIGVNIDVTERKRAESALRESERRLREMIDALPAAVYTTDAEGRLTHFNPAAIELSGRTPQLGTDRWCVSWKLFRPDGTPLPHSECPMAVALKEGRVEDGVEVIAERPDGARIWFTPYPRPLRNDEGKIVGGINMLLDITQRKHAEERERQLATEALAATAKFRAVFEQTTVFAGIMTLDGIVIDANQLCLEVCGYRAEDIVGRLFWETGWWQRSPEARVKIRAATSQAAHGTPYREVLTYHWADGTERLVDFMLHPIRDEQNQIIFLHPTGVDITDRKRVEDNYRALAETLEEQVLARTQELQHRNRETLEQSKQVRELSHRLLQLQDEERRRIARELHDSAGQVLTTLGMNLAGIVQKARESAPQLVNGAEEAEQLVRELSQEIRTTSYLLHPPLLDESGLPEALSWYIRGLHERGGLNVTIAIPEDFGRLSDDMELVLFRIVQECLTNVHRHSGSKVATIRIARGGEAVTLQVQDEGTGIPAEKLAQLQSQGGGVGIRGMRERVLQAGGEMSIESGESGTTISIALPLPKMAEANPSEHIPITRSAGI